MHKCLCISPSLDDNVEWAVAQNLGKSAWAVYDQERVLKGHTMIMTLQVLC